MALFDFLKSKNKKEKNESLKAQKKIEKEETRSENITKETDVPSREHIQSFASIAATKFVLISPHITERARMLAEEGQYTFRIHPYATKRQVKESVEDLYKVHVEHVQLTKVHEKLRRRGLTEGVKKGYKKAVVALRKGEAIDIF